MSRIEDIVESVLERNGKGEPETLIVANHLAQLKTFGIRQGVEFIPGQDRNGLRRNLIRNITQSNKIPLVMERLWDLLLGKGKLLFYLHPTGKKKIPYKVFFFHKGQYRAYYSADGDLEEVVVAYSYKIKSPLSGQQDRWRKIWIGAKEIKWLESDSPMSPDDNELIGGQMGVGLGSLDGGMEIVPNELGWIPCVETSNYQISEDEGADEFSWIGHQIERQDELEKMVSENLAFFGNQTLIATRSAKEVMEAFDSSGNADSVAAKSGFSSPGSMSTRKSSPSGMGDKGKRIKRVVGNVRADERFGYIAPDPVTGDHNLYISERRDAIRHALGGVPEEGRAGMTAFEVKSLFGRAAATAKKKCMNLYDYGLCLIFQMAIQAEEQIWREQASQFLSSDTKALKGIIKQVYPEAKKDAINQLVKSVNQTQQVPEGILQAIADAEINLPIEGIPPMGDPTVLWRWTGPVYEESSQDMLNKSIVGRNMAEDGVDRWSVLRFIYPDKTEEELKEMTGADSSIPFRRIQQTVQAIQMILGVQQQMGGIPNPGNPSIPLSAVLNLIPSVEKIISKLQNDIFISAPIEPSRVAQLPSDPDSEPGNEPAAISVSQSTAVPDSSVPVSGSGYAGYFGAIPPVTGQLRPEQSVAGSVQSSGRIPQPASRRSFPTPGAAIAKPGRLQYQPIASPVLQPQPQLPATIPTGMADQPGLLRQLFPTFLGAIPTNNKPKPKSKRSKK